MGRPDRPSDMRTGWIVLPLLLLLAGCGARPVPPQSPPPEENPLRGQTFLSTGITVGGTAKPLVDGTEVTLEFTDDGRLIARAGCNIMQGPVSVGDGKLVVDGGLATTEMGCDAPRHQQDEWLAGVLGSTPTWRLTDSELVVTSGDTVLTLGERSVVEPPQPLEGPTWTVDTLLSGETASSTTAGTTPATLTFESGQVKVFTGCNEGSAPYTVTGDTIEFGALVLTRKACPPEIMRQETAVSEVLVGKVRFEITASRLTVEHPSGKGIQLRAQ